MSMQVLISITVYKPPALLVLIADGWHRIRGHRAPECRRRFLSMWRHGGVVIAFAGNAIPEIH